MKQVEALIIGEDAACTRDGVSITRLVPLNTTTTAITTKDLDCQCLFMTHVEKDCLDALLNDKELWNLEKLNHPECHFT